MCITQSDETQGGVRGEGEVPAALEGDNLTHHLVEEAVAQAVFGNEVNRREFVRLVGAAAASAALAAVFPLDAAKALVSDPIGPLEKPNLRIGFIPITCAAPIIMAEPLGFYRKYGLNVDLVKGSGWPIVRDLAINRELDATHMLTPMPLAISLGLGSQKAPFILPTVSNINGQAITLHLKHSSVKTAADMRGFKLGIPFEYSMHNLLLRYFLAEGGIDPDRDVQLRIVPPPQMVANLRAETIDGFLGPDPFNQRCVYEKIGFIYKLTRDIWPGHPCCGFGVNQQFVAQNPNTFKALFHSLVDSGMYAHNKANRIRIAQAIAPKNYLNQPVEVVEQVLTGVFPDGLGHIRNVPDRVDYYPFPYQSMAVWILTQLKRWGYLKGNVNYNQVAQEVYRASECRRVMQSMGFAAPAQNSTKHYFTYGKNRVFDPSKPDQYIASFPIRRV